ncbi:glycoside hydrolase family 18 protein [Aspergillus thermomutatus]|uniref:chitinase n=1 Tax=Aspergillus thermomutatus TaxID=41047 RepID=A0A397GME6_ASPTH|nr:uncharacterized protein CDV56_106882 [Aspergillus thermomutatus]RHZ51677.1 hypothetical protein CDV56_106882 [Aspergillus thermomutatus]
MNAPWIVSADFSQVERAVTSVEAQPGKSPRALEGLLRLAVPLDITKDGTFILFPVCIPVGAYTHLNFAFLYIDPDTFEVTPMDSAQVDLYSRFTALKDSSPGLETWISVGGWAMNDPGSTQTTFSELAASSSAQTAFINSLKSFMVEYGFDGMDIDWEYPGASDRGGNSADYDNFVTLLQNIRSGLGDDYGLSITLPTSYWYMQHFDIVNIAKTIDWFNMMTYDIYGTWDATVDDIGAYVYAHTNLTMIRKGLDLLWHNDIDPNMVNIGYGFYGCSALHTQRPSMLRYRLSFQLGGLTLVYDEGNSGPCTNTEGILSYSEIKEIIADSSRSATVTLDSETAVMIAVFDDNQWVGYDDEETLLMKQEFADSVCIGGFLTWAIDQDNTGALSGGVSNVSDLYPQTNGTSIGGEIYIGPSLWTNDTQEVACVPPCTFILPPYPLSTTSVVTWPAFTTSVLVSQEDGTIISKETVISIDPFTITEVPFWAVTAVETNTVPATIEPEQSVMPPRMTFVLPGTENLFPVTQAASTTAATPTSTIAGSTSVSISTPAADWNPAVGDDCSGLWLDEYYCVAISSSGTTSNSISLGVTPAFYSTSHSVIIQPQPTVSVILPPSLVPPVSYSTGTPPSSGGCGSDSSSSGCGSLDCILFGCNGECGIFACDGGCGIGFCGGGCGLEGCGPGCSEGSCDHEGGGGGTGSESDPDEDDDDDDSCTSSQTADICTVYKQVKTPGLLVLTQTLCYTTAGCSVEASTTTTTLSTTAAACALPTIASNFPFAFGTDGPILTSITRSLSESIIMTTDAPTSSTETKTDDSGSSSTKGDDSGSSATSTSTSTSTSNPSLPSNYYELNLYSDDSCGDFVISAEGSSDNEYSLGCQPCDEEGVYNGVIPVFDDSLFSITVYKGSNCDSDDSVELKTSGTCYDVSFADSEGSFKIELA